MQDTSYSDYIDFAHEADMHALMRAIVFFDAMAGEFSEENDWDYDDNEYYEF